MLFYEFRCKLCDARYEDYVRETDITCCNEPVKRMYSLGGISFEGSGFHRNDYS